MKDTEKRRIFPKNVGMHEQIMNINREFKKLSAKYEEDKKQNPDFAD